MVITKEFCMLLLAGGIGAGSVVGVQQATPVVQKAVAKKAPVAKSFKPASVAPAQAQINDCPSLISPVGGSLADLMPMASLESRLPDAIGYGAGPATGFGPMLPGGGGGGGGGGESGTAILPPVPSVPEPGSWAMMLGGFGLIGLALRKNAKQPNPTHN